MTMFWKRALTFVVLHMKTYFIKNFCKTCVFVLKRVFFVLRDVYNKVLDRNDEFSQKFYNFSLNLFLLMTKLLYVDQKKTYTSVLKNFSSSWLCEKFLKTLDHTKIMACVVFSNQGDMNVEGGRNMANFDLKSDRVLTSCKKSLCFWVVHTCVREDLFSLRTDV